MTIRDLLDAGIVIEGNVHILLRNENFDHLDEEDVSNFGGGVLGVSERFVDKEITNIYPEFVYEKDDTIGEYRYGTVLTIEVQE